MKYFAATVFYPMLWLRGIVLFIGKLASSLGLFASAAMVLISIFTRYRLWLPALLIGVGAFLCFLLLQVYDSILFRLNPTGRTLILYQ